MRACLSKHHLEDGAADFQEALAAVVAACAAAHPSVAQSAVEDATPADVAKLSEQMQGALATVEKEAEEAGMFSLD